MIYCTDADLLHWEPSLFRDAAVAAQTLLGGSGNLSGITFDISAGSLADSHIEVGQVITLSGAIAGCFPIVSIASDTFLTLSVIYEGLYPAAGSAQASPVGTASNLTFAIRTFYPQRKVVSDLLSAAAGIGAEYPAQSQAQVTNPEALRRACILGTLQMIYSALAAVSADSAALSIRADLYERLYRRALARARVEIDLDGDGQADTARTLNVLHLVRE